MKQISQNTHTQDPNQNKQTQQQTEKHYTWKQGSDLLVAEDLITQATWAVVFFSSIYNCKMLL